MCFRSASHPAHCACPFLHVLVFLSLFLLWLAQREPLRNYFTLVFLNFPERRYCACASHCPCMVPPYLQHLLHLSTSFCNALPSRQRLQCHTIELLSTPMLVSSPCRHLCISWGTRCCFLVRSTCAAGWCLAALARVLFFWVCFGRRCLTLAALF